MASRADAAGYHRKLPPQNLEAEMSVIASVLLMVDAIDEVGELRAEHFYADRHQKLWQAIVDLHAKGVRGLDAVTVAEELDRRQQLVEIGGVEYFGTLMNTVPNAANAKYYSKIVVDRWGQRNLINTCTEILEQCYDGGTETAELVERAEQRILVMSDSAAQQKVVSIKDVMVEAYTEIQLRLKAGQAIGAPTGFEDLDRLIVGLCPNHLDVIAARPSIGKTALACKIALTFARREEPVYFVTIEMGKLDIAARLACIHGCLNAHELQEGRFSGTSIEQTMKQDRLLSAFGEVQEMPIFIDDDGGPTVAHIASNARRIKRKHGLKLVIVDYLQLIEPEDRKDIREQQVAKISKGLKRLAKELGVPVIVLAQLNRGVEHRPDKRPRLADLRESGAVEQDADVVMFLHRPEFYDPEDRRGEADLIVAKNRGGKTGTVTLGFKGESTLFTDLAEKAYAGAEAASKAFGSRSKGGWGNE